MAATVHVWEYNDSTGTDKNGTVIRFQAANDTSGTSTSAPILIPASNLAFSYEKWTRLYVTTGTYTSVSNTQFYWDGTFNADSTNFKLGYRLVAGTPPTYASPVKPANGTFPPATFSDAASYTSGSPLQVYASTWNTSNTTGAGANQTYLVLLLGVGSGATAGATAQETFTWTWDEV